MISQDQLIKRANWIFVIAWMIIIFGFSDQPAVVSETMSAGIVDMVGGLIRHIISFITGTTFFSKLKWLKFIIRKCAHAFLYLVLGILVSRAFMPEGNFTKKGLIMVLLICFLYAISDELHQLYLVGRSCEIRDIVIDVCSVCFGTLLRMVVIIKFRRKQHQDQ